MDIERKLNPGNSNNKGLTNDDWATPKWLFDVLNHHYNYGIDVCATPSNAKLPVYFTPDQDALKIDWFEHATRHSLETNFFCNPPYSQIEKFLEKAIIESRKGALTTVLAKCAPETDWFWSYAFRSELFILRPRMRFEPPANYSGSSASSGAASVLLVFHPSLARQPLPIYPEQVEHPTKYWDVRLAYERIFGQPADGRKNAAFRKAPFTGPKKALEIVSCDY